MKIICIGRNYAAHIEELKNEKPGQPVVFLKPDTALVKGGAPFYYPDFSTNIHHEVELVLKISKEGKYIQPQFAHRYFEEIGLGIDFTARDLQDQCKAKGLPWEIAKAFNDAIAKGLIGPVVLGRDHHDVSGTDSPYRETSNIYDGSRFTADMAIQNVIGDSFRGATWVSIHNGGGVGWGEVINGGFGMLLDGSSDAERRLKSMLHWDVNNGISRRSWGRNEGAIFAIKRAMEIEPNLKVTIPELVDDEIIEDLGKRVNFDIKNNILTQVVYTPNEWQQMFNLYKGSGLGLAHGLNQIGALRPANKDEKLNNVYYVGASTHPGTGLPIVVIGSRLVTERIINEH